MNVVAVTRETLSPDYSIWSLFGENQFKIGTIPGEDISLLSAIDIHAESHRMVITRKTDIAVWNLNPFEFERSFPFAFGGFTVRSLRFDSDGSRILVQHGHMSIIDLESGAQSLPFGKDDATSIDAFSWTYDSSAIVAVGWDGHVKLFKISIEQPVAASLTNKFPIDLDYDGRRLRHCICSTSEPLCAVQIDDSVQVFDTITFEVYWTACKGTTFSSDFVFALFGSTAQGVSVLYGVLMEASIVTGLDPKTGAALFRYDDKLAGSPLCFNGLNMTLVSGRLVENNIELLEVDPVGEILKTHDVFIGQLLCVAAPTARQVVLM